RLGGKSVRGDVRDNDNENGMQASLAGKTAVTDGEWHHVALVRADDGNVHLFVDGRLESTSNMPQAKGKITTDLRALGADLWCIRKNSSLAKFYYQGKVDEFCIFDRALSVDDIRSLAKKPADKEFQRAVSPAHEKARADYASAIAGAQSDYNAAIT